MGVGGNPGFRFSGDRRASPTRFGPHAQIPTRPQSAGGSGSCVHQQILEVQHLIKLQSVPRDPALVERVQAMMAEA
jgi:hypothetical protein